jgi:hypothetical protein
MKNEKEKTDKGSNKKPSRATRSNKENPNKKVRTNDEKTGRLLWVSLEDYKKQQKRIKGREYRKNKKTILALQIKYDSNIKSINEKDFITSSESLNRYLESNKLRNSKGQFLTKSEISDLKKTVKILEQQKVDFNLKELEQKITVAQKTNSKPIGLKLTTEDIKFIFYYQGVVTEKFDKLGEKYSHLIIIKDFNGNIIYEGFDKVEVESKFNYLNASLRSAERIAEEEKIDNPYFQIALIQSEKRIDLNGNLLFTRAVYDYSKLAHRTNKEWFNNIFKRIQNGEI